MNKINLNNLTQKELEQLQSEIGKTLTKHQIVNIKVNIDKNQRYVGKCYKRPKADGVIEFIMVVSALSSNEYNLECMIFENEILFERNLGNNFHFSPIDIYQSLNYDGIRIEDVPLLTSDGCFYEKKKYIDNFTEITQEEFFNEMDKYVENLKKHLKENKFNDLSVAQNYMKYYQ